MATIKQVAALAQVSVATVSRVLNKSGYVKRDTELNIIRAMEQLNYEPSTVARGLAGKSMATIALVLPDITNPFFPELARAVEDACQENGFTVLLCNSDGRADKEKSYLDVLVKRSIDGVIFAGHSLDTADALHLERRGVPFVVLDRAPAQANCSIVRSRNDEGAALAVQHLIEGGCRKIAHICGPQDVATARERRRGYEDAVRGRPWFTPSLIQSDSFQLEGGLRATEALLDRHPDIDAIFAANDVMAVGALKALRRRGLRVPEDVALCGFDGIAVADMTEPEISTVVQPIYDMGRLSAHILIQRITGEQLVDTPAHAYNIYELDVTLRIRNSSRTKGANT